MGFVFQENEEDISRSYFLAKGEPVLSIQSLSRIEIVPSLAFGRMLFMNGQLQLAKKDEYIYHEMLIHPLLTVLPNASRCCILGGGDGMAARELLKSPAVEKIVLVDRDDQIISLFSNALASWNDRSLLNPKVKIEISDCQKALAQTTQKFDIIVVDLFDPLDFDREFWSSVLNGCLDHLSGRQSGMVVNLGDATPWRCEGWKWILDFLGASQHPSLSQKDLHLYKVFVPSFAAEWAFLMIAPVGLDPSEASYGGLRYFDDMAWLRASLWTRDYPDWVPRRPVRLRSSGGSASP